MNVRGWIRAQPPADELVPADARGSGEQSRDHAATDERGGRKADVFALQLCQAQVTDAAEEGEAAERHHPRAGESGAGMAPAVRAFPGVPGADEPGAGAGDG